MSAKLCFFQLFLLVAYASVILKVEAEPANYCEAMRCKWTDNFNRCKEAGCGTCIFPLANQWWPPVDGFCVVIPSSAAASFGDVPLLMKT